MKRWFQLIVVSLLLGGCGKPPSAPIPPEEARRVVSLAPSLTECVYAVGAGDRLVGVSSFCTYPEEATSLPRIGGYTDTNYERIYTLQPDLVVLLPEHADARARLQALDIPYLQVDTFTIHDILATLRTFGEAFGTEEMAQRVADDLEERISAIRTATQDAPKRAVLVSIGRGNDNLAQVYAAGRGTLYDEMLEIAGASNVYGGSLEYAPISRESIMRLNPETIIDLLPDLEKRGGKTAQQATHDWDFLPGVAAVKNGQVHVFTDEYVCIPGPRFILTLEQIAHAIHPECFGATP